MTKPGACLVCTAPVLPPFLICREDGERLDGWVRESRELLREVSVTISRQSRTGVPNRGPSGHAEIPLPYNVTAAAARHAFAGALRDAYVRHGGVGFDPSESVVRSYLRVQSLVYRAHPAVVTTYEEIGHARRAVLDAIDSPPDTWYAGRCGRDGADLYAEVGHAWIPCPVCGSRYEVAARREQLAEAVRDYRGTASYLARALTPLLGRTITANRLWTLASRGSLRAVGVDGKERPLYRIGDVLDLLARPEARRHEAAATRR